MIIGRLTGWNTQAMMFFSLTMVTATYLLYLNYINRKSGEGTTEVSQWKKIFFQMSIGVCCFSAVQWNNLLWGFQVGFFLVAVSAAFGFYYFEKWFNTGKNLYIIPVILFGVISSYTSMHGLLVWSAYIGVYFLMLIVKENLNMKHCILILLVGSAVALLYMRGYVKAAYHPSIHGQGVFHIFQYFLTILGGAALTKGRNWIYISIVIGFICFAVSIAITIYLVVKRRISILETLNLNVFHETEYSFASARVEKLDALTKVETPNPIGFDKSSISVDNYFVCLTDTWAADFISGKSYQDVYVRINNEIYHTANGLERPDVEQVYNNPNFRNAGFIFSKSIDTLQVGANDFSVVVVLHDGTSYIESPKVTLYKFEEGFVSFSDDLSNMESGSQSIDISNIIQSMQVQSSFSLEKGLTVIAETGNDPQIVFGMDDNYMLARFVHLKFASIPKQAKLQLFYSNSEEAFSENNSIFFDVNPDQLDYTIKLNYMKDVGKLRLDFPSMDQQTYIITGMEVSY